MKIIGKKTIYKGKYLKVLEKEYLTKNKNKGIWEYIERKESVFIFALTKDRQVILERNYRIPLNSFNIELPAGLLDKKNESPKEAAKRELLEETGYLAKKIIQIFRSPLEPGISSSRGIIFFAPNVEFVGKKKGEDVEEIETIKVPLEKLEEFLLEKAEKENIDLKIFGVLAILKKKCLI